jgi:1,4-alpha-glucan branching enzyme
METKQSRLPTQRAPRPARTKSNAVTANVASSSNGIGSANHEDAKVRVRFKITANGAQAVAVAGTFNDWEAEKTPLKKNGDSWGTEVVLPRGKYEYRFVVDGTWMSDPNAKESVPNPYGTENSLLNI